MKYFWKKRNAIEFFNRFMPDKLGKHIQWKTLDYTAGSFVDKSWRWRHSDILFKVKTKEQVSFLSW